VESQSLIKGKKRSDSSTVQPTAAMPRPATLYNRRKWQLIGKSQWCCSANCGHPLHVLTNNWTRGMQLANTPPLQSTTPGLHPVSFHQMAPPVRGNKHPITAYYSVYGPRKDERLSQAGWLVTYRNKVPPPPPLMSGGREFLTEGAATENARPAMSVGVRGTISSGAADDRSCLAGAAVCSMSLR